MHPFNFSFMGAFPFLQESLNFLPLSHGHVLLKFDDFVLDSLFLNLLDFSAALILMSLYNAAKRWQHNLQFPSGHHCHNAMGTVSWMSSCITDALMLQCHVWVLLLSASRLQVFRCEIDCGNFTK